MKYITSMILTLIAVLPLCAEGQGQFPREIYVESEGVRLEITLARRMKVDDPIKFVLKFNRNAIMSDAAYDLESSENSYFSPSKANRTQPSGQEEECDTGDRSEWKHTFKDIFGDIKPGKYKFKCRMTFKVGNSAVDELGLQIDNIPVEIVGS